MARKESLLFHWVNTIAAGSGELFDEAGRFELVEGVADLSRKGVEVFDVVVGPALIMPKREGRLSGANFWNFAKLVVAVNDAECGLGRGVQLAEGLAEKCVQFAGVRALDQNPIGDIHGIGGRAHRVLGD